MAHEQDILAVSFFYIQNDPHLKPTGLCTEIATRNVMKTSPHESDFSFEELFYSKTDKKGIIQSGNAVFQRVSELPWEDLISRPHNVIRHPDMPRGVFHLLWEYLKSDKPIGAFVKNRSKTGKYYWVFALAMPIDDGYVSVRLKPGGELLALIEREYAALKTKEKEENLSPTASQAALLGRISELGFSNYDAFMTYALSNQIENRCREMKRPPITSLKSMEEMQKISATILEDAKKIFDGYSKAKFVPLNLQVYSERLGDNGKQLSVVANQYQTMAEEINREIGQFEMMSKEVSAKIGMSQLYVGADQLMQDVMQFLSSGDTSEKAGSAIRDLDGLSSFYMKSCKDSLDDVTTFLDRFKSTCESLQTMGSGLELVRITGKIETARLSNNEDLSGMLNDLQGFQRSLSSGLRKILECQTVLVANSKHLSGEVAARTKEI